MLLITGYPKTGNTWLQVMFSYIMDPNAMINGTTVPPSNTMFSHCMPDFNTDIYSKVLIFIPGNLSKKRVLLIIRHPGDTLVSLYMHLVYREQFSMYDGTIDEMIYDDKYGIKKFMAYYQWWWKYRKEPYLFSIIRYEDLLENTYKTFLTALDAIGLIVPLQIVRDAVEFGKFENMKHLEDTDHLGWVTLHKPYTKMKKARKVREGKIGEYRKLLKSETIEYIDTCIIKYLNPKYGYL